MGRLFKIWRFGFLLFRSFNDVTSAKPQNHKINVIPPYILSRKKRNRRRTATGNNEDWVTITG
jgi:hypothetical protein